MSQLEPTLDPALDLSLEAPPRRARRRFHIPGWFVLLLSNPKSRLGFAHGRLRDDHRADRAVDLGRAPARLQHSRDPPGALLEPPLRHDRPGERRLLAGRHRRAAVAAARRSGCRPRHRSRGDPRHHGGAHGRARRRHHQLPDQRLSRDSADPASRRHVRLHAEPRHDDDDRRPGARPLGVRGADPARAGVVAEEPRLRRRGPGRRRADLADRLRRARPEHDQPDRGRVRPRLLHRAARRRGPRVPRPRRRLDDELGRHPLLGADELDGAPGRVVAVLLPRSHAGVHRARARPAAGRDRRVHQPAPASGEKAARGRLRMLFGGRLAVREEGA